MYLCLRLVNRLCKLWEKEIAALRSLHLKDHSSFPPHFFFLPPLDDDDAALAVLMGVPLATPGATRSVSPVFSSTTISLAGCHFKGFCRYIGQGGRVNRQERMKPAARMYIVWEN